MRQLTARLGIMALAAAGIMALAVTGCAAKTAASGGTATTVTSHTATAAAGNGSTIEHGATGSSGSGLAQWVVDGTFEATGGSAQPLAGTVTFRDSATGHSVNVTVGASGTFSLGLAAGTYSATAETEDSDSPCSAPVTVTVHAGRLTRVSLVCKAT